MQKPWQGCTLRMFSASSIPQFPLPGLLTPFNVGASKPVARSFVVVLPQLPVIPMKVTELNVSRCASTFAICSLSTSGVYRGGN